MEIFYGIVWWIRWIGLLANVTMMMTPANFIIKVVVGIITTICWIVVSSIQHQSLKSELRIQRMWINTLVMIFLTFLATINQF